MKKGSSSKTAEYVCMGRAMAHGVLAPGRFDDPTALLLLPDEARRQVQKQRAGKPPQSLRERLRSEYLKTQSMMMVARTVAIDDAIRAARAPQVVILGAGLDGRAWRLPELRDVSVFEVDHADSQREKRERVAKLQPVSYDIRFVAVDFERDELETALAAAGHDETRPTTWVWEGVVMYLSPADIEATLAVVERRSAAGSRLIIAYHVPALILKVVGILLKRLGEPLRSAFRPQQMRALLAQHGFDVLGDQDLLGVGLTLSPEIGKAAGRVKHMHIVTAERVTSSARPDSPRR
jgi:methyltransferase (TIGR00027 family)